MRLPAKFLPKQSQQIGNVIGAAAITFLGLTFMMGYLPQSAVQKGQSFGQWLTGNGTQLPFLLPTFAMFLFGLGALAVALIDLLSGSPFNHLIVDRLGIRTRTLFGENYLSWKELGPIRILRLNPLQAFGLSRRFWIVSDTFSGETRSDIRRALKTFNFRFSASFYLGNNWFGSGVEPAAEATAAWLETLRQLAREERLESEDAPDAPEALGPGVAASKPADQKPSAQKPAAATSAPSSDLPAMADRKFGRRDEPTVDR